MQIFWSLKERVFHKKFLEHRNKNKCKLFSVDIDDCSMSMIKIEIYRIP